MENFNILMTLMKEMEKGKQEASTKEKEVAE